MREPVCMTWATGRNSCPVIVCDDGTVWIPRESDDGKKWDGWVELTTPIPGCVPFGARIPEPFDDLAAAIQGHNLADINTVAKWMEGKGPLLDPSNKELLDKLAVWMRTLAGFLASSILPRARGNGQDPDA